MRYEITLLTKDHNVEEIERLFDGQRYTHEDGGRKCLSYPFDGYRMAYYHYIETAGTPMFAQLLHTYLQEHADWVLRCLIVRKDTRDGN